MSKKHILLTLLCLAAWGVAAIAAPVAYWRHEEGPAGANVAAGNDTVLDSTGNGNHMQTFNPTFTAATYTTTVSPVPLRSGLPNNFSLDFGPGGDDAGLNDDNFTTGAKPVSSMLFNAITVEVAFRMDTVAGYQAILGKDGKPLGDQTGEDNSPVPPFKVLIRGDDFPGGVPNQLFIEWIDGDGTLNSDIHFLASHETVVPNKWYHVAMTSNATDAALWVAGETGPYVLKDSISGDFSGPGGNVLVNEPLGWSIGRGMFNNGVADWADALIDEARISNTVLSPNEFLFNAVPEPSSLAIIALGMLCGGCLRRR
jgi:concanavalin A-like lectin/glucanase superfamily protein/PEP-CTERM motif-containing protein